MASVKVLVCKIPSYFTFCCCYSEWKHFWWGKGLTHLILPCHIPRLKESRNKNLKMVIWKRSYAGTLLPGLLSGSLIYSYSTSLGMVLLTVDWDLLHQLIKSRQTPPPPRHVHRPILSKQFLHWAFPLRLYESVLAFLLTILSSQLKLITCPSSLSEGALLVDLLANLFCLQISGSDLPSPYTWHSRAKLIVLLVAHDHIPEKQWSHTKAHLPIMVDMRDSVKILYHCCTARASH